MLAFAILMEELDQETGSRAKIAAITRFLCQQPAADAAWAAALLAGGRRRRYCTSAWLRGCLRRYCDLPDWLIDDAQAQVGDTAEMVSLLIAAGHLTATQPSSAQHHDIIQAEGPTRVDGNTSLQAWCDTVLPAWKAEPNEINRDQQLLAWWHEFESKPLLLYALNKLLCGGFRLGVAKTTVAKAMAAAADVPLEVVTESLVGGFDPVPDWVERLRSHAGQRGTRPFPFYLASPLAEKDAATILGDIADWHAEWKWDGIRAQLIHRDGASAIWSRGEDIISEQFPEIIRALNAVPWDGVLDAELVAWDQQGNRVAPFHHLQRRLGRKTVSAAMQAQVPVRALVFDCLEYASADLRQMPLRQRLHQRDACLQQSLCDQLMPSASVEVNSLAALWRQREASKEVPAEGVMLKHLDSIYQGGRKRGAWWKCKRAPMTLDAVLIYAQAGSGRRANLFTDYTFALLDDSAEDTAGAEDQSGGKLVPFAKSYSGLNNNEISELDRWIRRHTIKRFGPVRSVTAERVFEIAFEGIGPSKRHKSGIAVRFPRILRSRPDKTVADIDTLSTAQALIS